MRFLTFILVILFLGSCSTEIESTNEPDISDDDDWQILETVCGGGGPPSPLQWISVLKKADLSYFADAPLDLNNASSPSGELSMRMHFGIYLTDINYYLFAKEFDKTIECFDTISSIGSKIGLDSVFGDGSLKSRFKDYPNNSDSLEIAIITMQEDIDLYYYDNDEERLSAIQFAGSWVELMHLQFYQNKINPDTLIGNQITEHMAILGNINKVLKHEKNSEFEIDWLTTDMDSILTTFDEFDSVNEYYEDESAEELFLTNDELSELSVLCQALRDKIIQMN